MKNKHRKKELLSTVLSIIVLIALALNYDVLGVENSNNNLVSDSEVIKIHFIDTRQSDCTLIEDNGEFALIDCRDNEHKEEVLDYLKQNNVDKIKYLFGTHPHEDHIGGMSYIIDNVEIENIVMPKISTNTKSFENVLDSVEKKKLKVKEPVAGQKYLINKSELEVLTNPIIDNTNLNISSSIMNLNYGDSNIVFTGDAEKENEDMLTDFKTVDILKVGHHGSSSSSSVNFIKMLQPKYSIIEVGADNKYGHPKENIVNRLLQYGEVYRTDEKGNIVATVDGSGNISFKFEK